MRVNVVEGLSYLHYNMSDFFVRKRVIVKLSHLHHSVKVHVEKFKEHVETVFVSDNLPARYNIRVFEPDHCLYLCVTHRLLPARELPLECL